MNAYRVWVKNAEFLVYGDDPKDARATLEGAIKAIKIERAQDRIETFHVKAGKVERDPSRDREG